MFVVDMNGDNTLTWTGKGDAVVERSTILYYLILYTCVHTTLINHYLTHGSLACMSVR